MNDNEVLQKLLEDYQELSNGFSRLEGMLESKLNNMIEEIKALRDADMSLHERISAKDQYVRNLETRVAKIESESGTMKWVIGVIIAALAAMAGFLGIS